MIMAPGNRVAQSLLYVFVLTKGHRHVINKRI